MCIRDRSSNLAATGAGESLYLCKADFTVDNSDVCYGQSVQFKDKSFSDITAW